MKCSSTQHLLPSLYLRSHLHYKYVLSPLMHTNNMLQITCPNLRAAVKERCKKFEEVLEGVEKFKGNEILYSRKNQMKGVRPLRSNNIEVHDSCLAILRKNRGMSICKVFTSVAQIPNQSQLIWLVWPCYHHMKISNDIVTTSISYCQIMARTQ